MEAGFRLRGQCFQRTTSSEQEGYCRKLETNIVFKPCLRQPFSVAGLLGIILGSLRGSEWPGGAVGVLPSSGRRVPGVVYKGAAHGYYSQRRIYTS
jgi:hypothetical protein